MIILGELWVVIFLSKLDVKNAQKSVIFLEEI